MSTDKIIIIVGGVVTIATIVVISFLLTPKTSTPTSIPIENIIAQNGLHWHPILEIYLEGKKQDIPVNIGILPTKHEELHTHDDANKGVIHMEMQGIVTKGDTKLGRFFEAWEKKFSSTQIFDKKNDTEKTVKMFVNGKENKEFEKYLMQDNDKIEIRYE